MSVLIGMDKSRPDLAGRAYYEDDYPGLFRES